MSWWSRARTVFGNLKITVVKKVNVIPQLQQEPRATSSGQGVQGGRLYYEGGNAGKFWTYSNNVWYNYTDGKWQQYNGGYAPNNLNTVYYDAMNKKFAYYLPVSEVGQRVIIGGGI